jgi:hypothetical protein
MSNDGKDVPGESAYEQSLKKLTDEQLAAQALDLKAKVTAHIKEMAKRFTEQHKPSWQDKKK